jgi:hypothetical protein
VTLKSASLLAMIGMLVLSVLVLMDCFRTVSGVLNGLLPTLTVFRSLVYVFASLTLTVLLAVMHRNA